MGCETQKSPADETSSAGVHALLPNWGTQHRYVVENDGGAHSCLPPDKQPATGGHGASA